MSAQVPPAYGHKRQLATGRGTGVPVNIMAGLRRAAGAGGDMSVGVIEGRRRTLQIALGVIWLLDAALQYQPYMFTRGFVTDVIQSTAAGNPAFVARPVTWSAGLMLHHIVVANAIFATLQLLLAVGLLWRPAVRLALAGTIVWAVLVWWLGEGLGGLLTGTASPLTGAPGAAILYAFVALLAWPATSRRDEAEPVATAGPLGPVASRALWAVLWGGLAYTALQPASRTAGGMGAILTDMKDGEPGWLRAMDDALAHALAGRGVQASIALAVLCIVAGAAVGLGRFAGIDLTRIGVTVAVIIGLLLWVVQDFGEIFTGQGTDPNTGPLLILLAAAFWPLRASAAAAARTIQGGRVGGEMPC
jgi:hypothetical protein